MIRLVIAGFLIAAVSFPASAQVDPMLMQALIAKRQAQIEAQREQAAADAAQAEQDRQTEINQHVGHLIAEGHCDQARAYALNEGNFALAHQVDSLCAPAPVAPVH